MIRAPFLLQSGLQSMDCPGHPTDIAPVVAFLLSDQASWFRGANLTPDGGLSVHMTLNWNGLD